MKPTDFEFGYTEFEEKPQLALFGNGEKMACDRMVGPYKCCSIVHGDSRELIEKIPSGYINLTLTDPPYGVGLEYDGYNDTQENLKNLLADIMPKVLHVSPITLLTPGVINIHYYPPPTWIMCWYNPAGAGQTKWGHSCWQPILCYGKDQFLKKGLGSQPDVIKNIEVGHGSNHPCPKPIGLWKQIIKRGLAIGDLTSDKKIIRVFDPFSGSGTTAKACIEMGLHFLGFEQSLLYVQECNRTIEVSKPSLF